jgi:hypothetical protein
VVYERFVVSVALTCVKVGDAEPPIVRVSRTHPVVVLVSETCCVPAAVIAAPVTGVPMTVDERGRGPI